VPPVTYQHRDPAVLRPQPSREGERDDWSTPADLRAVLIRHVLPHAPIAPIWEPAAGSGELACALRDAGYAVTATDGFDPAVPVDFLHAVPRASIPPILCTNPPFNDLDLWILHALALLDDGKLAAVILLLRNDHFGAACRAAQLNRASRRVTCCWRTRWIAGSKTGPRFWFEWVTWLPRRRDSQGPITVSLTRKDIA
jgi:hypothetical protein